MILDIRHLKIHIYTHIYIIYIYIAQFWQWQQQIKPCIPAFLFRLMNFLQFWQARNYKIISYLWEATIKRQIISHPDDLIRFIFFCPRLDENFLFGRFTIPEDRLHMSPIDARKRSVKHNYPQHSMLGGLSIKNFQGNLCRVKGHTSGFRM